MDKQQIIEACDKQINMLGEDAKVGFVLPGRWGKRDTKRLFPGGPIGKIVNEFEDGSLYGYKDRAIYVLFSAREVKESMLEVPNG